MIHPVQLCNNWTVTTGIRHKWIWNYFYGFTNLLSQRPALPSCTIVLTDSQDATHLIKVKYFLRIQHVFKAMVDRSS